MFLLNNIISIENIIPINSPVHLAHIGNLYPFIKKDLSALPWHPKNILKNDPIDYANPATTPNTITNT